MVLIPLRRLKSLIFPVLKNFDIFPVSKIFRNLTTGMRPFKFNSEERILIEDKKINYLVVGNGPNTILCLPGVLGFIQSDFRPQIDHLNKEIFTMVIWDPPGYGKSRPPKRDFSASNPEFKGVDYFIKDAKIANKLMKELGFRKFSLLGWSNGGITALILSKLFPDSVDKIVIWGVHTSIDQNILHFGESLRDINNWSPALRAPLCQIYGEEYLLKMWTEMTDTYVKIHEEYSGIILSKQDLNGIEQETLIIHGCKDPIVSTNHANFLKENIKNSILFLMPEGKHNLHLEYPTKFNSIVENFFDTF